MSKKRVLVIADVPGWAWAKKAEQLRRHLGGPDSEFCVDVAFTTNEAPVEGYDLYHTFEFPQTTQLPVGWRKTTGITAHVWQTWNARHGANTVRGWASTAVAVHANSRMLQAEIGEHLKRTIHYVPNGVDEGFYRPLRAKPFGKLAVGWVGKPNPRKGRAIVEEACARAGVEFRPVERNYKNALSPEEMREFYQGLHVLAVASDMDGTPNPALEAAACGCAVVSTRIGNMPEMVRDGENGHLVERDVGAMAAVLRQLAGDVRRTVLMGEAARETVLADWTWAMMAKNYADMWRGALR